MARKSAGTAKKNDEGGGGASLALVGNDMLGDVLGDVDLGITGVEETDASDFRLASLVWNLSKLDAEGNPINRNELYNTVSEETKKRARLALLVLHKSNDWSEFDEGEQRNRSLCRSWDRVTGEMADGTTRPCAGCPDKQWRTDANGKRKQNCADVANVVGLDLDENEPVLLRFKKTASRPWKDFLNKHILGKRKLSNGKRVNMPLFASETTLSLKMVEGKGGSAYAVPALERAEEIFGKDDLVYLAESAKAFRDTYLDEVRRVAEATPDHDDDGAANASFDPNEFSDDDGAAQVVDDAAAAPNRF